MKLFKKKTKEVEKTSEANVINNKEIKENLADYAINLLEEKVEYDDLAYTQIEFGYLFDFEDHGLEALFKVTTDKTVVYFAVQGTKMMKLDFNEDLYNTTVDGFLSINSL